MELIGGLVVFALLVLIIPGYMAAKRDRSVIGWILISLLITPLGAIIALAVLGRSLPESKV